MLVLRTALSSLFVVPALLTSYGASRVHDVYIDEQLPAFLTLCMLFVSELPKQSMAYSP